MEFSRVSLNLCWPMIPELPFSHKGGPSTSLVSCTRLRFPGGFEEDSQLESHLPWASVTRSPRTMIDASPPDWGDGKLGLPLVSIRPGIVARIGGEIHVPPYVRRGNTGGFRMARQHGTRQPAPGHRDGDDHRRGAIRRLARVTAMAAIQLLSRAAQGRQIVARRRQPQVAAMGQPDPLPRTPHGQWSVRL